jgi:hypothetical protein
MKNKSIHLMALIAAMVMAVPAFGRAAENPGISPSDQNPTNSQDEASGVPQLYMESGRYEFGSIVEGTPVVHDFTIKNQGNAPLIIEEVKTT